MNFKNRSYQPELLDDPHIPFDDIKKNMEELDTINRWLGGHAITIQGLRQFLNNGNYKNNGLHICEIGSGGGDNLAALLQWCKKKNITVKCTGIDINPHCVAYAAARYSGINFICSDYKDVQFQEQPDIIFSSLFCHHFTNEALVHQLEWMQQHAAKGFFINDLHRHPLAYYSIQWITYLCSKSYLVKNDAPLSVLRGFKKSEWQQLFEAAGLAQHQIQWKWAFRWLITCKKLPTR